MLFVVHMWLSLYHWLCLIRCNKLYKQQQHYIVFLSHIVVIVLGFVLCVAGGISVVFVSWY